MPKRPPPRREGGEADPLARYRDKRSADGTTEPFGTPERRVLGRGGLFMVHLHGARQLHFDLRLEWGGVLHSWALPKGPSLDPNEKRFAVHVEEHPLEYGDFEGVIPEGNYGAGPTLVWDRGRFINDGDPAEGLRSGKLLFELRGHKLRGLFTLVRTGKRNEPSKNWLLIKKPDAFAAPEGKRPFDERSVLSGSSLDELRGGVDRAAPLCALLTEAGAKSRVVPWDTQKVMLAEPRDAPFSDPAYLFELKYDGYRLLAQREAGRVRLRYRSGADATALFPELVLAVSRLPFEGLFLDGEVVALDARGRPDFPALGARGHMRRPLDIERASVSSPVTYFVFDLLALGGLDARPLPIELRKQVLRGVLPPSGALRYSDHVEGEGLALYAQVERLGLEGIVAKRVGSPYRGARHADWLKVRTLRSGDFVIVGYTPPERTRTGFRSLHLAAYHEQAGQGASLHYLGKVGSGFDEAELAGLRATMDGLLREGPPAMVGDVPKGRGEKWIEPKLVCEVRYLELSRAGALRHPVFLRMRDDKTPAECLAPSPHVDEAAPDAQTVAKPHVADTDASARSAAPKPAPKASPAAAPSKRTVTLSNLGKLFWPALGYTKGDLVTYYRDVAPFMLPYLAERPLVLTRYPDGIDGKSFFQKDAPAFAPDWVRTEVLWSEHGEREIRYFICESEDTLVYLANMAAIPLHVWASRVQALAQPDWTILDLDPKGAPFEHVIQVALTIRALCEEIALPCYVKTSGQAGLHVLVPLGGQCTFAQARTVAELLGKVVVQRAPDIATMNRVIEARGGRVYLDWLQNGHGRLLVAPYSARPVEGATVSAPLHWDEVRPGLTLSQFTLKNMPARARDLGVDPLLPVLTETPDLVSALGRLLALVGK